MSQYTHIATSMSQYQYQVSTSSVSSCHVMLCKSTIHLNKENCREVTREGLSIHLEAWRQRVNSQFFLHPSYPHSYFYTYLETPTTIRISRD